MTFQEQQAALEQKSWFATLSPAQQAFLLREEERRRREALQAEAERARQIELQRRESLGRQQYQSFLDRMGSTEQMANAALEARRQRRDLESETQRSGNFLQPYAQPQYSIGASQYFDALNQQRETQRREGLGRETYQSFLDRTGGAFNTAMGATATLEARNQRRGLESETQRLATERQVAETQQIREQAQQRRQSVAQRRAELAAQKESSLLAQQQAAELARQEADFRAKQRENDPYSQRTQRRMLGVQAGLGVGQFAPKTPTLPYQIEEDSEWAAVPAGFLGFGSSAGFVPRSQLSSMTLPPRPLEPSRYFAGYIRQ